MYKFFQKEIIYFISFYIKFIVVLQHTLFELTYNLLKVIIQI